MKIQLISDLHLEYQAAPYTYISEKVTLTNHNSDTVLVAAGDINSHSKGKDFLMEIKSKYGYKDIIYTFGNHEHYYADITEYITSDGHLTVETIIEGVRFLSLPLYSNFTPPSDRCGINDFNLTEFKGRKWTPKDHSEAFHEGVISLKEKLNTPFEGKTVVVTHFLPSFKSVDPQFFGDPLNDYFANNLDSLIKEFQPEYWLHGHTHANCNYFIDKTNVVCNPAGYYNKYSGKLENESFNPYLIIEV